MVSRNSSRLTRTELTFWRDAFLKAELAVLIRTRPVLHSHSVPSAGTFNAGRNAEKRAARADQRERRRIVVEAARGIHVPKRHLSRLTVDMLANRRLRQIGVR